MGRFKAILFLGSKEISSCVVQEKIDHSEHPQELFDKYFVKNIDSEHKSKRGMNESKKGARDPTKRIERGIGGGRKKRAVI
jgi:hypothetical protein